MKLIDMLFIRCCNQIFFIPPEIGYMHNLKYLSLANNQLQEVPDTIGCLTQLTELKLAHNRLTSLPSSIGLLKNLVILLVEHNMLKNLPSEVGKLQKLKTLDCSFNQLHALPCELLNLKELRELRIDECPLRTLFSLQTQNIPSLKELAARTIVRHHVPVVSSLPQHILDYFASAHECSFCLGPYFDTFVSRYRWAEKNDVEVHIEHRLCSVHWNNEAERISAMFQPMPNTTPAPLGIFNRSHSSLILNRSSSRKLSGSSGLLRQLPLSRSNSFINNLRHTKSSLKHSHSSGLIPALSSMDLDKEDPVEISFSSLRKSPSLPDLPVPVERPKKRQSLFKRALISSFSTNL